MIAFVVGRGMGHLGRCISIMNRLAGTSALQVHAFPETHDYLQSNVKKECALILYRTGELEGGTNKADVLIHDWRPEVSLLHKKRKLHPGTKTVSLYHSNFLPDRTDTEEMRQFKRHIRQVANRTDVFLHMNILQPKRWPKNMKCLYVPVPLITRKASQPPEAVKNRLGLAADESFILVHMGSGLGKHRYRNIRKWYKIIDQLADRYRFVIAGQLEEEEYPFNNKVVRSPLFPNGKDVVQAADLVITKPGMGILGDCISTRTPILMLPADNPERKQKIRILRNILRSDLAFVKQAKDLPQKIEKALKHKERFAERFQSIPVDGAEVAASIIAKLQEIPRDQVRKRKEELYRLTPFYSRRKQGDDDGRKA